MHRVNRYPQASHLDFEFPWRFSEQAAGLRLHSFNPPDRGIVALNYRANRLSEGVFESFHDHCLSKVHRQRQGLQNQIVAVPIDDHPGQSVALAPNDAAQPRIDTSPRAIFDGLHGPPLKEIEIEVLAPAGKTSCHDLRFAVVNRAPDQVILPVLERNDIAIGRAAENLQHFAREHPIVPVQNARPRFYDKSTHAEQPSIVPRRTSNSLFNSTLDVGRRTLDVFFMRSLELPGIAKLRSGKVREVFDLDETLLFVATDRLSAFDVILPDPIPLKGSVLNQLSAFWFRKFAFVQNHLITDDLEKFPAQLSPFREQLRGRSMIVRKTQPLPVECVVRGYLAGSGWKEYQQSGSISGVALPEGLQLASQLPEPIFTPSTKSEAGHDENIDWEKCCGALGRDVAERVKDLSLKIYAAGRAHAANCGIIVADTKFEFGLLGDELLLIDECLTPDSSRFWPADRYVVGQSPPSFDKQFVRDYLETLDWNKTPPGPKLPPEIIEKTAAKYREAFERLTSQALR
jgi:phosphoribosylaminoimidazole-succinocarboxamide synthase